MRQRTASITTRIKTHSLQHDKFALLVREQHPLQQGLRRRLVAKSVNFAAVREQHPLQQGLRRESAAIIAAMPVSENSIHYNKD